MVKFLTLICAIGAARLGAAQLPSNLADVLQEFRADGPRGWSFTQTTVAGAESLVENFDASQTEFNRWNLMKKDNHAPTPGELQTYNEGKTRRSGGLPAPRIQDQIDLSTGQPLPSDESHAIWRFRLKAGAMDDGSAANMAITLTFNLPMLTVERVEIASTGPFSPMFVVKIAESKTVMEYSLPDKNRPSLLQRVSVHLRGRAFLFKSLDQDMTVTYTDYLKAVKK